MTKPILEQPLSSGLLWRISPSAAVSIFAPRRQEEIFCPGGSAQLIEKAHFGQGNPRKSKPDSLDFLGSDLAGLCWIWLDLANIWIGITNQGKAYVSLRDRHHQPPPGFPLHDPRAGVEHPIERNGLGHRLKLGAVEVGGEPRPGLEPAWARAMDALDPDQRDAAQDERRDRRGQVHAAGEAASRDRAAVTGLRQHVGERRRADAVDR